MPNAAAAFAAVRGSIAPRLFSPSVSRIITRERPGASRSRFAAVAIAVPIAVPSSSCPAARLSTAALHDGIVRRQRHLRQRLGGERDDADAIARPRGDELLDDVLRDLEAILRLKVLREHRAREIDREDDVDALARHVLRVRAGARPRERDDRRREQQIAQEEQQQRRSRGRRAVRARSTAHAREHDRRRPMAPAPDPPDRQHEQEQEHPRRRELKPAEGDHAAASCAPRAPAATPRARARRSRAPRARARARGRSLTGRRANLIRSASVSTRIEAVAAARRRSPRSAVSSSVLVSDERRLRVARGEIVAQHLDHERDVAAALARLEQAERLDALELALGAREWIDDDDRRRASDGGATTTRAAARARRRAASSGPRATTGTACELEQRRAAAWARAARCPRAARSPRTPCGRRAAMRRVAPSERDDDVAERDRLRADVPRGDAIVARTARRPSESALVSHAHRIERLHGARRVRRRAETRSSRRAARGCRSCTRNGSPMRTVSGCDADAGLAPAIGCAVACATPRAHAATPARRARDETSGALICERLRLARAEEPQQRLHDARVGADRDLVDREAAQQMPPLLASSVVHLRRIARGPSGSLVSTSSVAPVSGSTNRTSPMSGSACSLGSSTVTATTSCRCASSLSGRSMFVAEKVRDEKDDRLVRRASCSDTRSRRAMSVPDPSARTREGRE